MTSASLTGLGVFKPETERDRVTWERVCDFVAREPWAFTRDAYIGGHVTASAFLLSEDLQSVLLTHHRKLDIWVQLGGHCDGIADTKFVAQKEAYEESGLAWLSLVSDQVLDVDIHDIPARGSEPAHLHYDVRYLMRAEAGEVVVSEESNDLAWVALDQVDQFTKEPSVLRMREKAYQMLQR